MEPIFIQQVEYEGTTTNYYLYPIYPLTSLPAMMGNKISITIYRITFILSTFILYTVLLYFNFNCISFT